MEDVLDKDAILYTTTDEYEDSDELEYFKILFKL